MSDTMQVLRTGEGGRAVMERVPLPKRQKGEALVRVLRAGVCNTDLEILKGYMGFKGTLGHEFVGRVEDIDGDCEFKVGQKVVGEINVACNNCDFCQRGGILKRNHCKNRTVLGILNKDGTFANYLTLPVSNLFPVPDEVTSAQAAFAEPLAAAFRIVEQDVLKSSDTIAVIGDGKLGLLIVEVMAAQPHKRLVLFGKHEHKMNLAPTGVEHVLVDTETGGKYEGVFDVCVEASGTPSGIMMASTITRAMGTIVFKSTCAADADTFNTSPFVVKELNIIGSRCGNFKMALDALKSGKVKVEKLLSKVYPFNEAEEAIKHAATRGTLKIQLMMCDDE